jgi:hypothetical protein
MTPLRWAIVAGLALGFAYTLSPLTVLFVAMLVPLWRWAISGLTPTERRWVTMIFAVAVAVRFAAIAGLFMTADPAIPYANFFGDEEFFKRKTTWLRNVAMGIPISTADFLYAFDVTGNSSYVTILTYLQAVVGLAPYGIHAMNACLYLAAISILYKLMRPAVGGFAALFGFTALLFMPSLFAWSISALKEPLYFMLAALNLYAAVYVIRAERWPARIAAAVAVIGIGLMLQGLREGGLAVAIAGVGGGFVLSFLIRRPRLLLGAALAMPLVVALALSRPAVQDRAWSVMHQAAEKHWGHINTPGQTFRLMDSSFYVDRKAVNEMTAADAARYTLRAMWAYVTVPLPWQIESRSSLAFLPEQMIWLVLLALAPIGVGAVIKRDPLIASLLITHGFTSAMIVALSGGNVGTLVRHRGLVLPYLVWLSGAGAVRVGLAVLERTRRSPATFLTPADAKGGL